jgi:hypothetical protein
LFDLDWTEYHDRLQLLQLRRSLPVFVNKKKKAKKILKNFFPKGGRIQVVV